MGKKRLLGAAAMIIAIVLSSTSLLAQKRTITGIITDQNNAPLVNATVSVKGNKKSSTTTDANGAFKLTVADDAKALVISYVGMKPQEIALEGRTNVLASLNVTDTHMNEVVVIGYGSRKRSDITSSISSISERDIKNLPVAGVDQALQGKVAGVTVTSNSGQPGGGVSLRVRGITSVNGDEPLYVIDGVPVLTNTTSIKQDQLGGKAGQSEQSILATMNPSDIASIDILKDASAQAIYGSQGANGVVLITTKRGKAGEGKLTYDVYYGWQSVRKKLDVMNLQQFAGYFNSLIPEIKAAGGSLDTVGELKNPAVLGPGTDWQDAMFQTGTIRNHQLSFSGGQAKTTYYFSLNYFDQAGTVIGSSFNRYAARFSIDQQVKSWLKAGISSNLSRTNQRVTLTDGTETPINIILFNSPATPVKDAYGQYITTSTLGNTAFGNVNSNPIATALLRDVRAIQSKGFGNIYAEIPFLKSFTLRNELAYDFQLLENNAFQPNVRNDSTKQTILTPSKLREDRNTSYYYALRNYLTWNQAFGRHALNVVVGHEAQYSHYENLSVGVTNLTQNLQSPSAGTVNLSQTTGTKGDWSMESYFARGSYTYDNRYSVSGSIRRDGSSSFGPNSRIAYFPAVSAGWTVTNENFAKNLPVINYLKLRAGYGSVGNQNSPVQNAYSTNIRLFTTTIFGIGTGGLPANVGNPGLSWESVVTYNAGMDVSLLNRRIELSVDVYKKTTTNMILSTTLPVFAGLDPNPPNTAYKEIEPPVTNAGEMTNKGIDIGLTTYNIQNKDFNWKTNIIFSRYKNLLVRLNAPGALKRGEEQDFTGSSSVVNVTQAGHAVGTFYGYVTDGLFRNTTELTNGPLPKELAGNVSPMGIYVGDIRFKDLSGDKTIGNDDVTFIGDPNPKFTYGITNTFQYKGFDFSFFLQGVYGDQIFNWTRKYTEALSSAYINQLVTVMDRFTPNNPNASMPRYNQWTNNNTRTSDRYVENGSYLRVQNISLGYNLPLKWIGKVKMTSARLYLSAQNLHTFTSYSGYDPEIGAFNKSALSANVDNGHYPNPRSITLGANIEF